MTITDQTGRALLSCDCLDARVTDVSKARTDIEAKAAARHTVITAAVTRAFTAPPVMIVESRRLISSPLLCSKGGEACVLVRRWFLVS